MKQTAASRRLRAVTCLTISRKDRLASHLTKTIVTIGAHGRIDRANTIAHKGVEAGIPNNEQVGGQVLF
jgi:hypothetical protein